MENPLDSHRFKVGQNVRYTSNMLRYFRQSAEFRVVKLLPAEGNEQQYRIKSTTEPHERVAKESQLDVGALSGSMIA